MKAAKQMIKQIKDTVGKVGGVHFDHEEAQKLRDLGEGAAMTVTPCTIKAAQRWIALHHRHLPLVNGGRFAVAVSDETGVRGVGLVGNGPRVWEGTSRMVITRVATDGVKNGCSMIYGALCRAGAALGYTEAWTYTLPNEPGTSLRAAGFVHMGESAGKGNLLCAHSQNSDG